jgi:hypothetical protein
MKLARVCPIFKANSRFDVGNNRPVSILIIISKILEKKKTVYLQLEKYSINFRDFFFEIILFDGYMFDTSV